MEREREMKWGMERGKRGLEGRIRMNSPGKLISQLEKKMRIGLSISFEKKNLGLCGHQYLFSTN